MAQRRYFINIIRIKILLIEKEVKFLWIGTEKRERKLLLRKEYKPVKSNTSTYFFPFQGSWGPNKVAFRNESDIEP